MSYRELWVFIAHLPQESWTQTALRDSPEHADMRAAAPAEPVRFGPWSLTNYQLAEVIDAIQRGTYTAAVVGHVDPAPTFPKPTPRPGAEPRNVRALTPQGVAYLRKLHARPADDEGSDT